MYPLKKFVECAIKAKKCNTGSILVYDINNIEYFAHHSLVEKMKSKFNDLFIGKELYFIYEKEVWSGAKWNNKQVNNIVFIAYDLESINSYLKLIKEKDEILRIIYQYNSRIIELYETDTRNFKKLNETKFNTISDSDKELKNILEIQNSNENTRTELENNIESLRKRLNEIYAQIEI